MKSYPAEEFALLTRVPSPAIPELQLDSRSNRRQRPKVVHSAPAASIPT